MRAHDRGDEKFKPGQIRVLKVVKALLQRFLGASSEDERELLCGTWGGRIAPVVLCLSKRDGHPLAATQDHKFASNTRSEGLQTE